MARRQELIDAIENAFAGAPAEHWLDLLEKAGIASGKVRTMDEVYEWAQARSQGLLLDVAHQVLGPMHLPGPPLRFDGVSPRRHVAPPLLGEHNESVLAWLDGSPTGQCANGCVLIEEMRTSHNETRGRGGNAVGEGDPDGLAGQLE